MPVAYDPQSNSLQVEHTRDEYLKAVNQFGLYIWGGVDDDIGHRIAFRHEHAHFTSILATDLSELRSIVQDWKHTILVAALQEAVRNKAIVVPVLRGPGGTLSAEQSRVVIDAWTQATWVEGYLLGFGTSKSVGELFRFSLVDRFVETFDTPLTRFNAPRFRKLLKQINFTTSFHILNNPAASMPNFRADGTTVVRK